MSNRPNFKAVYNLAEFKDRRRTEGTICIELGDGEEPILIPPPELWPDDLPVRRGAKAVAIGLLGQDEFDRFVAAGGSGKILDAIFLDATKDTQGVEPGES